MKGKKVLSVLLASVMMFTAVPVGSIGAMAAPVQNAQVQEQKVKTQTESGLSNIAATVKSAFQARKEPTSRKIWWMEILLVCG